MTGAIYIIAEAEPAEIARLRDYEETPEYFKVGKATKSKLPTVKQVQKRLDRLQSCNVSALGAIRVFEFPTIERAKKVEEEFHACFRDRHGVGVKGGQEWYRDSLGIAESQSFLVRSGGKDVTVAIPNRIANARYEIDLGTDGLLRLLALELAQNGTVWWKIVAARYPTSVIVGAYRTGNHRQISAVREVVQPQRLGWPANLEQHLREQKPAWIEHQNLVSARAAGRIRNDWHFTGWVPKEIMEPLFADLVEKLGA